MYMDIFNLSTETGFTIEAYAFRMQGVSTDWIEAKASEDSEFTTVVSMVKWAAFITVDGENYTLPEVTDIDFGPEPSELFPILTLKETE